MQKRNNRKHGWAIRLIALSAATLSGLWLQGCQDGVSTNSQPQTSVTASTYSGPSARTEDIQNFRISLWEPLRAENRCGACHGTGGQAPLFVREDDVNLAYEATNPYINRAEPDESSLVTKVANGHNCWEASDTACASIITNYIEAWVGSGASTGREIELEEPVDHVVGESKQFPADSTLFATYVHPLLTTYCAECHVETATSPQSPYFSDSDADVAYAAVRNSIDLDTPLNSRLVQRLLELHNCWDDCPSNAAEMETAITLMSDSISPTPIDPALVVSRALSLPEGIVASGGSRHETDLIALYEFKTGQNNIAYDTSGVDPAINLNLSGSYSWVEGWGVQFNGGKAQGTTSDSSKLAQLIQATGEYTIEAWVVPANVTQEGPARIISYSAGETNRNFTLGQTLYRYDFMHRSSTTDANGEPAHTTADGDEDLQASEQHVVVTFDPTNGRRTYVNGVFTDDVDATAPGTLNDWDDSYALVLGSEVSGAHAWEGKVRLLAIHNRSLDASQIQQNFDAGVGEKYFLLFNVTDLVSLPQSYVMFEVSQFDNYSYMFRDPRFISLDETVMPGTIALEGMRIGINGKEAAMGQAYTKLVTTINDSEYTPNGQSLSNIGTTIPLEKGSQDDQFFLTFERLGSQTNVYTEPAVPLPAVPADSDPVSRVGLRTFEEISASMSALTGVSRTNSAVDATYQVIKQQLPSSETINGFLSSHQVGVSQLAIEYCSEMVDDTTLRSSFFPDFDFSADANGVPDATWETDVVDPIINNFLGQNISTQPLPADVRSELMILLTNTTDSNRPTGLARCGTSCAADRAYVVTKAACASVLGSAAVLLQ
jgi:cytochrome c553